MALRDTLIATALDLLEASRQEPSLRAVARAAGVSAMAPYNHFADKAGLMAAVSTRGFEAVRDLLAAADGRTDPGEALAAQGTALVGFASRNPALFRLMYSPQHGGADPEAVRATHHILADRVAAIVPPEAVAAATLACRALVQGMAMIVLDGRLPPSGDEEVAGAVRLLVRGLLSGGPPRPRVLDGPGGSR